MKQLLLFIAFLLISFFVKAQEKRNVLEISHRAFYFPEEGLIYKNSNGFYFLLPPTIHLTRYSKKGYSGIQCGFNTYYQEYAYTPVYGNLRLRTANNFELSYVYRLKRSPKVSLLFSPGLTYRDSWESRFIRIYGFEGIFQSAHIQDIGFRGGISAQYEIFSRWFLKANAEYQGHLVRLNQPDIRNKDFKPVYHYFVFDLGIGFAF